jgi:hypothetical protein
MVAQSSLASPDIMSLFRDLQSRGPAAPAADLALHADSPLHGDLAAQNEPFAAALDGSAELDLLSLRPQMPEPPEDRSPADSTPGRGPDWTAGTLIERIMELNPSASVHFLSRFNDRSLREYLEHLLLQRELEPRTGEATLSTDPVVMVTRRWVRPIGRPGILSRDADA